MFSPTLRPPVRRADNIHGVDFDTFADCYEMTKSQPDLVDSKYIEYRRPWYKNPDYKGPTTNSYNVKSIKTLSRFNNLMNSSDQLLLNEPPVPQIRHRRMNENRFKDLNSSEISEQYEHSQCFSSNDFLETNYLTTGIQNCNLYSNSLSSRSTPESAFCSTGSQRTRDSLNSSSVGQKDKKKPKQLHVKDNSHRKQKANWASSKTGGSHDVRGIYSCQSSPGQKLGSTNEKQVQSHHRHRAPVLSYNEIQSATPHNMGTWSGVYGLGSEGDRLQIERKDESETRFSFRNVDLMDFSMGSDPDDHSFHPRSIYDRNSSFTTVSDASSRPSIEYDRRFIRHSDQSPNSMLWHSFSYLDTKSLAICGAVCRQWYYISRHPSLWRRIRIKDTYLPPVTFKLMSQWSTEVREISLQNILPNSDTNTGKPVLEYVENGFEASLEKLIEINKNTLNTLRIVDCDFVISGHVFWAISMNCAKLEKLVYFSKANPIGQEDLYPLGRGCKKITSLIIPPGWPCALPDKFCDGCCETISKCWPKLQVLCIGGQNITIDGLYHIAKGCVKLQKLEIDHGPEITEKAANKMVSYGFRGLEQLDLTFTPISPRAVVILHNACPKLDHIGIHCNISNYFPNPTSSKSKSSFILLKTLFKRLKCRPVFSKVLDINLDYEEDC